MKIKVCGMRDPQNISQLAELKPEYMGFIFYPKSKRYVESIDKELLSSLSDTIKLTGVFVNEEIAVIIKRVIDYSLRAIQLHGAESPEFCRLLKESLLQVQTGRPIELIKAFGMEQGFNFSDLAAYDDVIDYYLFDTKTPMHGGAGFSFDWTILKQYDGRKPFFLSGGLSPDNLKALLDLNLDHLYALDLNSKFEIEPGLKDIKSLRSAFQLISKLNNPEKEQNIL